MRWGVPPSPGRRGSGAAPSARERGLELLGSPAAKSWTLKVLGGLGCAPLASWAADAPPEAERQQAWPWLQPAREAEDHGQDYQPVGISYIYATVKAMGLIPSCLEAEMTVVSSLEPTPCAKASGPAASRLGLAARAKSALSAAVAIGLMGLTTGCQGESASPSASATPSQSPSTSQIQTTGPTQTQSPTPNSASQIQSPLQTPSPTQSQIQSPTQGQSPSPIQSLSPSPSPSQSATAAAIRPPASGFALAVRVNPDAAQLIISSDTSDPGVDLTPPINQPADVAAGAPATPAAPGPLPIFGAAAAFGASRQLRKRIKGHS